VEGPEDVAGDESAQPEIGHEFHAPPRFGDIATRDKKTPGKHSCGDDGGVGAEAGTDGEEAVDGGAQKIQGPMPSADVKG